VGPLDHEQRAPRYPQRCTPHERRRRDHQLMAPMKNDGRDLQRLIRVIEQARAAGTNIKIQSPQFFPDRVTGKPREHDVVLTIKHDHHELVVALECRDRSRPVGVGEVEAFHTKCRDTGVHSGIIVSSKGFRLTAREKAQHYGIRCLILDEVEAFGWLNGLCVRVMRITAIGLHLRFDSRMCSRCAILQVSQ
jgi:Restriction endonuclease